MMFQHHWKEECEENIEYDTTLQVKKELVNTPPTLTCNLHMCNICGLLCKIGSGTQISHSTRALRLTKKVQAVESWYVETDGGVHRIYSGKKPSKELNSSRFSEKKISRASFSALNFLYPKGVGPHPGHGSWLPFCWHFLATWIPSSCSSFPLIQLPQLYLQKK